MKKHPRIGVKLGFACLGLLAAVAPGRAAAGEGKGFMVGPYLQNPGRTGITVMWMSKESGECTVRYGKGTALDREVKAKPAAKFENDYKTDGTPERVKFIEKRYGRKASVLHGANVYEVRLAGLTPGTTYRYEVTSAGEKSGGGFRTSPAKPGPFTFIIYGDTRTDVKGHRSVAARFLKHKPEFIIHTGDMSEGEPYTRWHSQFFEPLAEVMKQVPLWPVRGNHEGTAVSYRRAFAVPGNERWYSFDYGNVHFVCLDSQEVYPLLQDHPDMKAQRAWLEKDLAASKAAWKIVLYHKPSYDLGLPHYSKWGQDKVVSILLKHRVDLVYTAHAHSYQRFKTMRVGAGRDAHCFTHVISGGGGAPLAVAGNAPHMARRASVLHYNVLNVEGGKISVKVFTTDGKVMDSFELAKKDGRPTPDYLARAMPEKEFKLQHSIFESVYPPLKERIYLDRLPTREQSGRITLKLGAGKHGAKFTLSVAEGFRKLYEMKPVTGTAEPGGTVALEVVVKAKVKSRIRKRRIKPALRLQCDYEVAGKKGLVYTREIRARRK